MNWNSDDGRLANLMNFYFDSWTTSSELVNNKLILFRCWTIRSDTNCLLLEAHYRVFVIRLLYCLLWSIVFGCPVESIDLNQVERSFSVCEVKIIRITGGLLLLVELWENSEVGALVGDLQVGCHNGAERIFQEGLLSIIKQVKTLEPLDEQLKSKFWYISRN